MGKPTFDPVTLSGLALVLARGPRLERLELQDHKKVFVTEYIGYKS